MAAKPPLLTLACLNRGHVLAVTDAPLANDPDSLARLGVACAALHHLTGRRLHFQLRDPADGRAVLVLEHGDSAFRPMRGRP